MKIVQKLATKNECYQVGNRISPIGVMIHSTGCNQTSLSVYYSLFNVFHPGDRQTCPHAFIGKNNTGNVETWQMLPWHMRGWHSGSGRTGNANRMGFIGIEICEDDLSDATYFWKAFGEAVSVTAFLCREYDIPTSNVICHSEGHTMGIASNHADVMHWFPKHGADMNFFRSEVGKMLAEEKEKEPETPTQDNITSCAAAYEAVQWALSNGIMKGDPDGNLRLRDPVTREEAVILLHRVAKLLKG